METLLVFGGDVTSSEHERTCDDRSSRESRD
jgi:hypothetical protein